LCLFYAPFCNGFRPFVSKKHKKGGRIVIANQLRPMNLDNQEQLLKPI
jgi:hypothetical protein